MSEIQLYKVGGCVRDELLGVHTKDIDYAVEAESFSAMREYLQDNKFEIFLETPQFLTIRARFPRDHEHARLTADFVLCRKDGRSSNSRHPDSVTPGTIFDDLARRDFTVNAMARKADGILLDPHNGLVDLTDRVIRFVGDPDERIYEDALRVLRAVRFCITKGFQLDSDTADALKMSHVARLLTAVSTERIREELHKAFQANTLDTIELLTELRLMKVLFIRQSLWLEPTMKGG